MDTMAPPVQTLSPKQIKALAKAERKLYQKKRFWIPVVGLVGVIAIAASISSAANKVTTTNLKTETTAPNGTHGSGATLAEFNQLADGMTYTQAASILGSGGTVISSSGDTVMYQWQGKGFASNMNAMFQGGKLITKAQFGLN